MHSDKKKMLEELTNDIHQSPNKQKVLMELANCIGSGKGVMKMQPPTGPLTDLLKSLQGKPENVQCVVPENI